MVYSVRGDRGVAEPSYLGVGFHPSVSAVVAEFCVTSVARFRCKGMSGIGGASGSGCLTWS
jgi:hypothetical protein